MLDCQQCLHLPSILLLKRTKEEKSVLDGAIGQNVKTWNGEHSELLSFWTLSIVQYSKILENKVSETGSVSILRSGGSSD
jgi:hypothetical protein